MSKLSKYHSKVVYLMFDGKKQVRKRITAIKKSNIDYQNFLESIVVLTKNNILNNIALGFHTLHKNIPYNIDMDVIESDTHIYIWFYTFLEF